MRADKFFAEKYGSRTKAAQALEKGLVLIGGIALRPKDEVRETDEFVFLNEEQSFVSNGGYKLARAIETFEYSCKDKIFVDLGASTGGFTDCLLQNGAAKIYAVDVGESLLHESLLENEKIVRMENTNARYLTGEHFSDKIDCIVTDVSFISLRLIFPAIKSILGDYGDAFVLIKPQFECEKKNIGKSGIVHTGAHADIVKKVLGYAIDCGLYPCGIVNAPLRKGKNIEYIVRLTAERQVSVSIAQILETVKNFLKERE